MLLTSSGGKWWTGGEQNELTGTSILETSGSERRFYEGNSLKTSTLSCTENTVCFFCAFLCILKKIRY